MIKTALALAAAGTVLTLAPVAGAFPDPDMPGCDTVPTGSLIDQRGYVTFCDGPIDPDGSWERKRTFWGESNRICTRTPLGMRRCWDDQDAPINVYKTDVYRIFPDAIPFGEPGYVG